MANNIQNSVQQATNNLREFATKTQGPKGQMDKNDFLNLFMTQVSNQDPLSPMDSSGMMTQLSQLGSMEQLQNLNKEVSTLNTTQTEMMKLNATGLLGQEIAYKDNTIHLEKGKLGTINFKLSDDSKTTQASIINGEGKIIRTLSLGTQKSGINLMEWDGKDDRGTPMPEGKYTVEMMAVSAKGREIPVDMNRSDRVNRIEIKNNKPVFYLGNKPLSLAEINYIHRDTGNLLSNLNPLPTKEVE